MKLADDLLSDRETLTLNAVCVTQPVLSSQDNVVPQMIIRSPRLAAAD